MEVKNYDPRYFLSSQHHILTDKSGGASFSFITLVGNYRCPSDLTIGQN
jgi:hypothetical protein